MEHQVILSPAYVIKARELLAINYLGDDHPRPRKAEWINRGTDQVLRPTTTAQLLRTLYQPTDTPSIQRLHDTAGLRVEFRSQRDRDRFADDFEKAREAFRMRRDRVVTAVFDDREKAEAAVEKLVDSGINRRSISLLCRANQFMEAENSWPQGHSTASVAGIVTGSGMAGALLGVALLFVPGVGQVAAAGAIAASAIGSVASVSGIIGATGGAIAKMLTDHDVDGVSAAQYEGQIRRGKIFLSVDTGVAGDVRDRVIRVFRQLGGRAAPAIID